jgi:hypothetical protein
MYEHTNLDPEIRRFPADEALGDSAAEKVAI